MFGWNFSNPGIQPPSLPEHPSPTLLPDAFWFIINLYISRCTEKKTPKHSALTNRNTMPKSRLESILETSFPSGSLPLQSLLREILLLDRELQSIKKEVARTWQLDEWLENGHSRTVQTRYWCFGQKLSAWDDAFVEEKSRRLSLLHRRRVNDLCGYRNALEAPGNMYIYPSDNNSAFKSHSWIL